jgi:hypothetical protein
MTFNYYLKTASLYSELSRADRVDSREVAPGVVLDFDAEGHVIDIDHACQQVDLTRLEANSLPIQALAVA